MTSSMMKTVVAKVDVQLWKNLRKKSIDLDVPVTNLLNSAIKKELDSN